MATSPLRPSTMRTMDELPVAAVMKSISATVPFSRLEDRFENHGAVAGIADGRAQGVRPAQCASGRCPSVPTRAAKQAGLSKRGQHSQSIEPSRLTSAALWQSPISA